MKRQRQKEKEEGVFKMGGHVYYKDFKIILVKLLLSFYREGRWSSGRFMVFKRPGVT